MVKYILLLAIDAYSNLLLVSIVFSMIESFARWTPPEWLRPPLRFCHDLTEPFLRLFRNLLPGIRLGAVGFDMSPILAFVVLIILRAVVLRMPLPA